MSKLKNIAKFNVAISELIDVPNPTNASHPFATMAKFIFADDQPNGNHQGIKVEEFPNLITSAVGMPIKMNFTGLDVSDHAGSIPIGHIKSLEPTAQGDTNLLIAEAMLWKEEFPDEVSYLKDAFNRGEAPGLSYEIAYQDSVTEQGTQWITGTTTQAATFVKHPAYGSRTHLLALASLGNKEERETAILALANEIQQEKEPKEKGGNLMEEELKLAQAEVARLTAELAARDSKVSELEASLATAETDKGTALAEIAAIKETAKIDNRIRQYVEAGFTIDAEVEKADALKTVFASFNDDQWDFYLTSLKSAKPALKDKGTETALASLMRDRTEIPRVELDDDQVGGLKEAMKLLARPHSI